MKTVRLLIDFNSLAGQGLRKLARPSLHLPRSVWCSTDYWGLELSSGVVIATDGWSHSSRECRHRETKWNISGKCKIHRWIYTEVFGQCKSFIFSSIHFNWSINNNIIYLYPSFNTLKLLYKVYLCLFNKKTYSKYT